MAAWRNIGTGSKVAAAVAAAALGIGLIALFLSLRAPLPEPIPEPAAKAPAPETAPIAEAVPAPKETAPVAAAPPLSAPEPSAANAEPPRFDVVRIEKDGAALVAGRAVPGSEVSVLVDGAVVVSLAADGTGGFAAQFTLPQSAKPRLMTLLMRLASGQEIASQEQVVLAPADVVPPSDAEVAVLGQAPAAPVSVAQGQDVAGPTSATRPVQSASAPRLEQSAESPSTLAVTSTAPEPAASAAQPENVAQVEPAAIL
ncbi:MAG: hypothetical protein L0H65_19180, partial [Pseudorhodobacter sp.]|nr:hypothetical protein [Pseudorhodobacter sp.]